MCVGSPTAGTWSSSRWRPDDEFETDRLARADTHGCQRCGLLGEPIVSVRGHFASRAS